MSRVFVLLSMTILLAFAVRGEHTTIITGNVTDEAGLPLRAVMIRTTVNDKNGLFVMTDAKGAYTLQIKSEDASIKLSFSKLGYEQENVNVENKSQRLDMVLSKSAEALPEVTVTTPEVRLRGDTLSFLLSAFAGKDDVSLKDALKKVPGVEVSSSGEISYNGKKISNFYIEGMDLMGGKYDIATTNIPASYVNAIEILNNHKDRKIDRDIFSDNVAMNVRLKPKAKFRPTGTYSASAGIGKTPMPMAASGAGMMFREKFQSILTLKGTDIKEFSRRESYRFFDESRKECKDYTESILGRLSASQPPLSRERWIRPIDASATANFIHKINDNVTLRTDIGYSFLKTEYDYSDSRIYFDGEKDVVIEQFSRPQTWSHTPSLGMEYKVNKDDTYFSNSFTGTGAFSTDISQVDAAGNELRENERLLNFDLRDNMHWGWRRDKWRLNLSSSLELNSSPEGSIEIFRNTSPASSTDDSHRQNILQHARSQTFLAKGEFYAIREIKRSHISIPVDFSYTNHKIRTALSYQAYPSDMDKLSNHLNGHTMKLSFSPGYEYSSPYDKFVARITLPLTLKHINWDNSGTKPYENISTHLLPTPSIYLNYKITAKSSLRMQASYQNNIGDILDLLTASIMRDYISTSSHSGHLSKTNSLNASLHYDFKLPLSFWYFNADISYSNVKNNLLSRQNVNSELIEISDFIMPHHNDLISGSVGISKNIRSIKTKISLKGGLSTGRNKIEQNKQLVTYQSGNVFLNPSLTSQPLDWLGLSYDADIYTSFSKYLGQRQSFDSQRHDIGLSVYPLEGLQIQINAEIIRKEIIENKYNTLSLFDVRFGYNFKKIRLTCDINNILNHKSYSYTIFNALNRFTYNYRLRGRELIVSIEYHL